MKIAVLTCTRDRLPYTEHCFRRLRELAGCDYDHFVLDQASTDGTQGWLTRWRQLDPEHRSVVYAPQNIGIAYGMNVLLDRADEDGPYDAIVKIDNDCELLTPRTLAACARIAIDHDAVVSPQITGLRRPPAATGTLALGAGEFLVETPIIGGIFLAAPASFYDEWRCPTDVPLWAGDDDLMARARELGLDIGYVAGYEAAHYLTTDGQHEDMPWYFDRKRAEGCPA